MLAYRMNGKDLEVAYGAPLRLRVERHLGYKHREKWKCSRHSCQRTILPRNSLATGSSAHKEEKVMLKYTIAAIALAAASALPAFAQDAMMSAKCDEASMMKMQADMDAMKDPAMKEKKEMASKEMMMAKDSMKANKMEDCKTHMEKAMKSMSDM
jgi:hypothetical protein